MRQGKCEENRGRFFVKQGKGVKVGSKWGRNLTMQVKNVRNVK